MNFAKLTVWKLGVAAGALLVATQASFAQSTNTEATNAPPARYDHLFQSDVEKISYAIGAKYGGDVSNILTRIDLAPDYNAMLSGFRDRLYAAPKVTDAEVQEILTKSVSVLQKQLSVKNHKLGDEYRAEIKQAVGAEETPSGIIYRPISGESKGVKPGPYDTVTVNYRVSLIDGTECDSSARRGQPTELEVSGIIAGLREALQLMPVGAKWNVVIPPELAYGEAGSQPPIGPGCTLVFEIELLSTKPPAPGRPGSLESQGSGIIEVPSKADLERGVQPHMLTPQEAEAIAAHGSQTNKAK